MGVSFHSAVHTGNCTNQAHSPFTSHHLQEGSVRILDDDNTSVSSFETVTRTSTLLSHTAALAVSGQSDVDAILAAWDMPPPKPKARRRRSLGALFS